MFGFLFMEHPNPESNVLLKVLLSARSRPKTRVGHEDHLIVHQDLRGVSAWVISFVLILFRMGSLGINSSGIHVHHQTYVTANLSEEKYEECRQQ